MTEIGRIYLALRRGMGGSRVPTVDSAVPVGTGIISVRRGSLVLGSLVITAVVAKSEGKRVR